jgi:hypothetical protein
MYGVNETKPCGSRKEYLHVQDLPVFEAIVEHTLVLSLPTHIKIVSLIMLIYGGLWHAIKLISLLSIVVYELSPQIGESRADLCGHYLLGWGNGLQCVCLHYHSHCALKFCLKWHVAALCCSCSKRLGIMKMSYCDFCSVNRLSSLFC